MQHKANHTAQQRTLNIAAFLLNNCSSVQSYSKVCQFLVGNGIDIANVKHYTPQTRQEMCDEFIQEIIATKKPTLIEVK